jgi:ABC-type phosphate/phosphonate transport system substrate-binding protein
LTTEKSATAFADILTSCCRALIPLLLFMLLAVHPQAASGAEVLHTSVAFSKSTFVDVSKEQAQSIATLWTDLVASKWGTSSTRICNTLAELEKDLRSKNIDLVVLISGEYLALREKVPLDPLFIPVKGKDLYDRLVLVVRKDSGSRSLSDLKGKTLFKQRNLNDDMWLDTLLMRQGVRNPERFFLNAREMTKPSASIFAVFFRKADACIVTQRSLRVMAELNPQLSSDLLVLEESPPWPVSIIAVRKGLPTQYRETIQEVLGTLDQNTQGKQLLTLFRMDSLVPFRPKYLTQLEGLFRENKDLKLQLQRDSHK